jgi:integrase
MPRKEATPKGALVIVPSKDGSAFHWEAKWRYGGRQIKRRLGRAYVAPRDTPVEPSDGERVESWRLSYALRRGRPSYEYLRPEEAQRAMDAAIRAYAEDIAEAERLEAAGLPAGSVTFGQLADAWIADRRAEVKDGDLKASTARDYASMLRRPDEPVKARGRGRTAHIMREFDEVPVGDVTAEDVDAFSRKLRVAGLSPQTRKKYEVVVSMIFDYAVRGKAIDSNPMTARPRAKRRRKRAAAIEVYSLATVEAIAGNAGGEMGEMIRLAAVTGLRQGELLGLTWRDVDWPAQSITVRHRYLPGADDDNEVDLPKSGKARTVPMSDQAGAVLDRLSRRERFIRKPDLVFPNDVGEHTDPSTVRRAYAAARDAVLAAAAEDGEPLPRLTFHGLRHTFGSRCAAAGVPLATIMAWMGHEDVATTMVYVHFMPHADDAARLTRAFATGSAQEAAEIVA